MMEEQFDYAKALERLEELARISEDPSTGLSQMDSLIKESSDLVQRCRLYLRQAQDSLETL